MSQRSFQAIIARMVIDTEFRAHVRERGLQSLADDLTPLEQERLLHVASDRGMEATRLVHKDFRLSKLYIMLPLTRFLLGRKRMMREVSAFWSVNPPVSHYFLQEAMPRRRFGLVYFNDRRCGVSPSCAPSSSGPAPSRLAK